MNTDHPHPLMVLAMLAMMTGASTALMALRITPV